MKDGTNVAPSCFSRSLKTPPVDGYRASAAASATTRPRSYVGITTDTFVGAPGPPSIRAIAKLIPATPARPMTRRSDRKVGAAQGGIGVERRHRPVEADLAVFDDVRAVGEAAGELEVLLGHHDRQPLVLERCDGVRQRLHHD